MRKIWLVLIGVFLVVNIVIGIKNYIEQQQIHEKVVAVVRQEEADGVFEEGFQEIDANAFTEYGVIQTYKIDYTTVNFNTINGITGMICFNNDTKLHVNFRLDPNDFSQISYSHFSSSLKKELEKLE